MPTLKIPNAALEPIRQGLADALEVSYWDLVTSQREAGSDCAAVSVPRLPELGAMRVYRDEEREWWRCLLGALTLEQLLRLYKEDT